MAAGSCADEASTDPTQLMIENNLGVNVKEVYEVKQIDGDYFVED